MAAVLFPPVQPILHDGMPLDQLHVPEVVQESTRARMPRPGLVEALMQLKMLNMDSPEQDEAGSNDSQDSTPSHSSSYQSQASSATDYSVSETPSRKAIRGSKESMLSSSRRISQLSTPPRNSWYISVMRKLPSEVVNCIVEHLEASHIKTNTPQSYVKDLYSLSLTTRAWDRHVREHLYHTLFIRFSDLQPPSKKMFSKPKTRLKTLRRTLRERPVLARYVKEIRVLDFSRDIVVSPEASVEIRNTLASLVMACPRLERLTGLYPPHFHDYDRLAHALSTRHTLKEKLWVIGPNHLSAPGGKIEPLNAYQIDGFIQLHSRWTALETLVLSAAPTGVLDHHQMFFATFRYLTSLKNLHISGFSAYDFNDSHLTSFPTTLQALRLEALPGISEEGLMHYFTTLLPLNDRANLTSVTLIDMNLHFLTSISSLLGHLYNLRRFTLITSSLDPPSGIPLPEIWQPFCSSRSLEHLHWEINPWINSPSPDFAHYILAESIAAGGFPRLRRLRCPNDASGILQAVCRPLLPPSRVVVGPDGTVSERVPPSCPTCAHVTTDTTAQASHHSCSPTSLTHIRTAALARAHTALFPARRVGHNAVCRYSVIEGEASPYIRIVASDEDGMLIEAYDTPRFLGALGTNVPEYVLEGDLAGMDAMVAGVEDVVLRESPRWWLDGKEGEQGRRTAWDGVGMDALF